ncbi:putative toxin-antitoxin system toxin component, PIN family [Falsiroseomonas sp.]|uniref:putative toxin-antitoxin system toxin component, PIN family n=1 Tax=Falsiroseomonas sp. TaxID=2870721 RepID=UPI003F7284ED
MTKTRVDDSLSSDVIYDIMVLRVVLDTDVMVAGFASAASASRRLLLAALDGELRLLLSTPLILEYEAVLTRASVLEMAGISVGEVLAVLDEFAGVCVSVAFDFRVRPDAREPDDDLVLETAVNGGADVIATFNLADLRDGSARFGISVERPADLLRRMRG